MDKKRKKGTLRALAICLLSTAMLLPGGCGRPKDEKISVYVIGKNNNLSFWDDVQKGAEDAGEELDMDVTYKVATGDNDYATQIEFINQAIDKKVDVIVIAPNGEDELIDAFQRAEAAGIKIVCINSRTNYSGIKSCIASSDKDGAAVAARNAVTAVLKTPAMQSELESFKKGDYNQALSQGKGSVAIIANTASTAEERVNGFKKAYWEYMSMNFQSDENSEEYKELTENVSKADFDATEELYFVQGKNCSNEETAYAEAKKMLTAKDSNIKVFFATNTYTTLGVCHAIEDAGLEDDVYVVGYNTDSKELEYLRKGMADGLVMQNPYNMGYVGVNYARKLESGEVVPISIDTGVTYVTAENMNNDYIQLLLNPSAE